MKPHSHQEKRETITTVGAPTMPRRSHKVGGGVGGSGSGVKGARMQLLTCLLPGCGGLTPALCSVLCRRPCSCSRGWRCPGKAPIQAGDGCPTRDPSVSAFDRFAHPQTALCTPRPRDHTDVQLRAHGGREALAGGGPRCFAGSMRGIFGAPLRGLQPVRDPRETRDHHGQGYPACAPNPRLLGVAAVVADLVSPIASTPLSPLRCVHHV